MVTKNTKFSNLFNKSPLSKYSKYFYYGFNKKFWADKTLGYSINNEWNTKNIIKVLNKVERMYKEKKLLILFPNKNKPGTCIMLLKQHSKAKLAIVAAGGYYRCVATAVESLPIACKLYEKGFTVAVINYSIGKDAKFEGAYEDLLFDIKYLNENQNQLNIDFNNFIIGGCSAGGHLVARYGTDNFGYFKYKLPKPGLMFLAYPLITMGKFTNEECRNYIIGKNPSEKLINEYSIENHVSKMFPNTFVWQTSNDCVVSIQNTKMLVKELKKNNIPHMCKTYESDVHGWGDGTGTLAKNWINEMLNFYKILLKT